MFTILHFKSMYIFNILFIKKNIIMISCNTYVDCYSFAEVVIVRYRFECRTPRTVLRMTVCEACAKTCPWTTAVFVLGTEFRQWPKQYRKLIYDKIEWYFTFYWHFRNSNFMLNYTGIHFMNFMFVMIKFFIHCVLKNCSNWQVGTYSYIVHTSSIWLIVGIISILNYVLILM